MMRSLKYQLLSGLLSLGAIALVLLAFIPYTMILVSDGVSSEAYYSGMCFGVLIVFAIIMPLVNGGSQVRMALASGATRRGWFWGNVLSKIVLQLALFAYILLVCVPLSTLIFSGAGEIAGNVLGILEWAPLILPAVVLLSAVGEALGYVMSRFNGKVMMAVVILLAVIGAMGLGFLLVFIGFEQIMIGFTTTAFVLVCLVLYVVFEFSSWRLIRRMAA